MKKVAICSLKEVPRIKKSIKKAGFVIDQKNPDFVFCYGGDGTILFAESKYPSVPKLTIKSTEICHRCDIKSLAFDAILRKIKKRKYRIVKDIKLQAISKGRKLIGLNEIQVHTKLPIRAIRFSVSVGKKKFSNLIGDGVIVATPFGSTAYYTSSGGKPFKKGIGISFNNLFDKKIKSLVFPDNSKVRIKVERGPAFLFADNNEKFVLLNTGDTVTVSKSKEVAKFIQLK